MPDKLIALVIIGLILSTSISSFKYLSHSKDAQLTVRQLELAIAYARSLALSQQQQVSISPIAGNWRNGLCVQAQNGKRHEFSTYLDRSMRLSLQQSGQKQDKVQIQADGLSFTNGHFSLNDRQGSQLNLYFNKGLRVYRTQMR